MATTHASASPAPSASPLATLAPPLTVKAAAVQLGMSIGAVYDLVHAGRIGHLRMGTGRGSIRFLPRHVNEYLAAAEVEPSDMRLANRAREAMGQILPKRKRGEPLRAFRHLAGHLPLSLEPKGKDAGGAT